MSLMSIIVYSFFLPYNSRRDNLLSVLSNAEVFFVILVAFLLKRQRQNEDILGLATEDGLGYILIIFNIINFSIFIGWVVIKVAADINDPYGRKVREAEEKKERLRVMGVGDTNLHKSLRLTSSGGMHHVNKSISDLTVAATKFNIENLENSKKGIHANHEIQFYKTQGGLTTVVPVTTTLSHQGGWLSGLPPPPSDWAGYEMKEYKAKKEEQVGT